MEYYLKNAQKFIDDTFNNDMSSLYFTFEKYLPKKALILDIGFGSGRDSLYFQNAGYIVHSIEPIEAFCEYAKSIGLKHIYNIKVQQMTFDSIFDGIWACASLLHISSNEITDVFNKCYLALKENGIMYCSFKYGDFEGERDGRFFVDFNEEKINKVIRNTKFSIIDISITEDVRLDNKTKWLNIILKK